MLAFHVLFYMKHRNFTQIGTYLFLRTNTKHFSYESTVHSYSELRLKPFYHWKRDVLSSLHKFQEPWIHRNLIIVFKISWIIMNNLENVFSCLLERVFFISAEISQWNLLSKFFFIEIKSKLHLNYGHRRPNYLRHWDFSWIFD